MTAIEVREPVNGLTITTGDRTEVRQIVNSWMPGSVGAVTLSGTTLTLDGCGWWCTVRYEVTVAGGVNLSGRMGSGGLSAQNLGSVAFTTGSGSIQIDGVRGPVVVEAGSGGIHIARPSDSVRATTGSGSVTVTDALATVVATTGSGNIDVTLSVPVSAQLRAGSGNITVRVPRGPYRMEGVTGSGRRDINVATDPASSYVLTLDTGSGNVSVQPR